MIGQKYEPNFVKTEKKFAKGTKSAKGNFLFFLSFLQKMTNSELLGAAGETHGLVASNRLEERDNSAPVLNALPHAPPDYHPTEAMRSSITPILPPSSTQATTNDHTLPHAHDPSLFIEKKINPTKIFNPMHFQTDPAHIDPANNHSTSGDTRNEVVKGGGLGHNGVFTAHGGNFEGVLTHKGGLGWGDNQSAEMGGGLESKSDGFHPIQRQENAQKMIDARRQKGGSFIDKTLNKIPMNRVYNDTVSMGLNEIGRDQRMKGSGIKEKHTELVGGGFKAMGHGHRWTGERGGKSKFWRNMAVNLTGLANNVSKAFAENSEGAGIKPKKVQKLNKMKGGKSKAANQIARNVLGTAENLSLLALEAA